MTNMKDLLMRLVGEKITLMYSITDDGKGVPHFWDGKLVGVFGDLLVVENPEKDWKTRFTTFDLTLMNFHSVSANINPLVDGDHDKAADPLVS